jgi:hypothetical protein
MVVALIALFVALGGAAVAAIKLPRNSVGTAQLVNGAVTGSKLGNAVVTSVKVRDHCCSPRIFGSVSCLLAPRARREPLARRGPSACRGQSARRGPLACRGPPAPARPLAGSQRVVTWLAAIPIRWLLPAGSTRLVLPTERSLPASSRRARLRLTPPRWGHRCRRLHSGRWNGLQRPSRLNSSGRRTDDLHDPECDLSRRPVH